jgi:hypothetical protein
MIPLSRGRWFVPSVPPFQIIDECNPRLATDDEMARIKSKYKSVTTYRGSWIDGDKMKYKIISDGVLPEMSAPIQKPSGSWAAWWIEL